MAHASHYEIKPDHGGGKDYASRNYNDMRQVYEKWGVDRSQVDWLLQLRQVRPTPEKLTSPEGLPSLSESKVKDLKTKEHEDGAYKQQKYGNTADTGHMLRIGDAVHTKTVRPIVKEQVHFQSTLRSHKPIGEFENKPWRRHFGRYQVSFDIMSENCGKDNEAYQKSHITPQDRRPDRSNSALPIATLRDASDYCFEGKRTKMRFPGCEGASWTQWRHLVHPGKVRDMIKWETTLHGFPDNRGDQSKTDMLGKKKWQFSTAGDKMTYGDSKLEYLKSHPPILGEPYKRKIGNYGDELSKSIKLSDED
jgi:hypothetical protein